MYVIRKQNKNGDAGYFYRFISGFILNFGSKRENAFKFESKHDAQMLCDALRASDKIIEAEYTLEAV